MGEKTKDNLFFYPWEPDFLDKFSPETHYDNYLVKEWEDRVPQSIFRLKELPKKPSHLVLSSFMNNLARAKYHKWLAENGYVFDRSFCNYAIIDKTGQDPNVTMRVPYFYVYKLKGFRRRM